MRRRSAAHRPPPPRTRLPSRRLLGRGRSGSVYEEPGDDGSRWACKVFLPDRASTLVMTLLTGAANPYRWNRHAVTAAVLRRRVLAPLVSWWFRGRLRLPRTGDARWDGEVCAFTLRAELVRGRHAMLRHPLAPDSRGEVRELARDVLRPLQRRLASAGFDGLLWQAGRGNPVAAGNFLREIDGQGQVRWAWIDTESGVPALFPLNPWHLLRTYLPLSLKHRRWLFDDVDTARLRAYLDRHAAELAGACGAAVLARMRGDVDALEAAQRRWKAKGRHRRSLASHLATGRITFGQARAYARRPARWLARLAGRAALRAPVNAARWAGKQLRRLAPRRVWATLVRWVRFFSSERVRARWARRYVLRRVLDWRSRGFLTRADARAVRRSMQSSEEAAYVADFGVHLAIKPGVKLLQWGLVPLLYAFGIIESGWLAAALIVLGGAAGRTAYTLWRSLQALVRGRSAPWAALAVGLLPVAGNAAYPMQLLAASTQQGGLVAKFLLHDVFSAVGRRLPVWGGRDSLMEHRANCIATLVTRA